MRPAFSSTRQAAGFAVLLLLLLLLPALLGKSCLPSREQMYAAIPWGAGDFPFLHDQIFQEKEDIDIAFMGSSRIWCGLDTAAVEAALGAKLGRKAVVRTLGWSEPSFDPFYVVLKDLVEHRKVRMVVFCDLSPGGGNAAHSNAPYWFRWGDNAGDLAGLSNRSKASFYGSAILGMPRNLLGLLRENLPVIPTEKIQCGKVFVKNPSYTLGALDLREPYGGTFETYAPPSNVHPSEVCVTASATNLDFRFLGRAIWPMQAEFARKIGALAHDHGVKLVYLHMPLTTEGRSENIDEPVYWPDYFGANLTMVGIAPARLFRGISGENESKLFFNYEHLNQNGQKFFTSIVAPRLLQVYEDKTKL